MNNYKIISIRNKLDSNKEKSNNGNKSRKLYQFLILEETKHIIFDENKIKLDLTFDSFSKRYLLSYQEAIMAFDKVFFISDLHFSDNDVFYYYRQNYFDSTLEMNDRILLNWNSKVSENSLTFILGDIVPNKDVSLANHFLKLLNGYKILVNGNHDPKEFSTPKIISLTYDSLTLILVHALGDVNNNHKNGNVYYLHGHTHNLNNLSKEEIKDLIRERMKLKRSLNVNLEFHDFKPLEIEKILDLISEC